MNEEYQGTRDLFAPENLNDYDEEQEAFISYADYLLYDSSDIIWWKKPIALYPIRRVDRLTTQGGYFTIHGSNPKPIDAIVPATKNIWKKIEMRNEAIKSALLFLNQAGINHYTMFPDLDGLAKLLNSKYFN